MTTAPIEEQEERLSIRIDADLRDAIQKLADRNERTFSGEVRHALRLHLEREDGGKKS